jgi:probable phosphoglycerate mutase
VIAERAETIGVATNNVAEYRGLIAGLELAAEHAPEAELEVRMDSRLVVEQMSGSWKIKHPDMLPLAAQAKRLAPAGTVFTWVPRAENTAADLLVNEALDGKRSATAPTAPARGWSPPGGPPTTLVLVRHGATDHTSGKRFSGGLGGRNPSLNDEGRDQVRATGEWLAPLAETVDVVVSSPVRRTHETAEIIGALLDRPVELEPAIAEMEFGSWEGLTFAEVREQYPDELSAWLGDLDQVAGGGESFRTVAARVLEGRDRIVASYPGKTVLVVSHVTPIKVLVADALGAPLEALFRMELSPASVTVVSYFRGGPDGDRPMANLRLFNARPTEGTVGL